MADRKGNAGDRTGADSPSVTDRLDAAGWFAHMRGPGGEADKDAFDAWRAVPENAAAYARAEENWLLLAGVAPEHLAAHPRPAAAISRNWLALAAGLFIALAAGLGWTILGVKSDPVRVAANQTGEVRLGDGTMVTLFDGARVEARFSGSERRVVMTSGRARFAVAHETARPFRVEAAGSETTALGTVFEIDMTRPYPVVHLVKGSVEVRALRGTAAPVRLKPGEYAETRGDGTRRLPGEASTGGSARLEAGVPTSGTPSILLVADDLPLASVLDRASAMSGARITLGDPALANRSVTGRFDVSDARSLARKLAAALDLEVAETESGPTLKAREEKTRG